MHGTGGAIGLPSKNRQQPAESSGRWSARTAARSGGGAQSAPGCPSPGGRMHWSTGPPRPPGRNCRSRGTPWLRPVPGAGSRAASPNPRSSGSAPAVPPGWSVPRHRARLPPSPVFSPHWPGIGPNHLYRPSRFNSWVKVRTSGPGGPRLLENLENPARPADKKR